MRSKEQAQEKLAKFRPKVGYPNKWRDYSRLEVKRDDLVGNLIRAYIFENEWQSFRTRQDLAEAFLAEHRQ